MALKSTIPDCNRLQPGAVPLYRVQITPIEVVWVYRGHILWLRQYQALGGQMIQLSMYPYRILYVDPSIKNYQDGRVTLVHVSVFAD